MWASRIEKGSQTRKAVQAFFFISSIVLFEPVLAHDGISLTSPLLETTSMERAVSAAEWLVERSDPERVVTSESTDRFAAIELLIWMARADEPARFEEFSSELTRLGYGDPSYAVSLWVEDFIQVLSAYEARRLGESLSNPAEIEAEIRTLPTVPLDVVGVVERDQLLTEQALAATPFEARAAVGALEVRIDAVLSHVTSGGAK